MKTKTQAQILICKPDIHLSIQGRDTAPANSLNRAISLLVIVLDGKKTIESFYCQLLHMPM